MLAIRKELRPAMANFSAVFVQRGRWSNRPTLCRDSHQRTTRFGRIEYDRVRLVPRPALDPSWPRIANALGRSARDRDLLELLVCEESDELAIWRPERKIRSHRTVEALGGQRI